MLPEVFRIPGLDIPILTYGLLLTIAFIVALWITTRLAANDGIPKNRVYDLAVYTIPSALLGSKGSVLKLCCWNPSLFLRPIPPVLISRYAKAPKQRPKPFCEECS